MMKTFKWTFPELPLSTQERNDSGKKGGGSGLGKLFLGFAFLSLSILYFSTDSDFIRGLRSYAWDSTKGQVVSSELKLQKTSGIGEVIYRAEVNGTEIERTSLVFNKWSVGVEQKYEEWTSRYSVGSTVDIYFSENGETSLGHWPTSYSYQYGIWALWTVLLGLILIVRGIKEMRLKKNEV